jgi:hypothetical protein
MSGTTAARLLLASMVCCVWVFACSGPRVGEKNAAPAAVVFALGVSNNASGPPQSASRLTLAFGEGDPGPERVVAKRVSSSTITVDGDGNEWGEVAPSAVPMVGPGQAIGMTKASWDAEYIDAGRTPPVYDHGVASASVRAAFDDQNLYLLVEWADATENRWRQEWHSPDGGPFIRSTELEDALVLAFNIGGSFADFEAAGCTAACHVKERLGENTTEARNYRFLMHTNDAGERVDVWNWRATRSGPYGVADDSYWDQDRRRGDVTEELVISNAPFGGPQLPLYMGEGGVNSNPEFIFLGDAGLPRAVPFNIAGVLPGARIPGLVHQASGPARREVRGVGKWKDGRWTVELSRALTTDDPNDAQFPLLTE